jgi:dimethylargininase
VITNPGAPTRRGETDGLREILGEYFIDIETIHSPGTLDGGDVMKAGDHYYIGISKRTNTEGADQLINILRRHGVKGVKVELRKILHLKSGASYLENDILLVAGEISEHKIFERFNRIEIDDKESYAANSLWVNGKILIPEGFPRTRGKIEKAGYETIALNVSEFRKVDGGLSCLSLRF